MPTKLARSDVHLWIGSVGKLSPATGSFLSLLSLEEQARAERFADDQRRQQYVVARGLLRALAGSYLHCPPQELVFAYNEFGKPHVADVAWLDFNVSHSQDLVVLAFAKQRRLGVDVQKIMTVRQLTPEIANRVFAPRELTALCKLDDQQKEAAFSRTWVIKEAYLKGVGCGLSQPLNEMEVSLAPERAPKIRPIGSDGYRLPRWRLQELALAPDYAGALAVEGYDWRLKYRFVDAIRELNLPSVS